MTINILKITNTIGKLLRKKIRIQFRNSRKGEIDKTHGIYSNRWGDAPIWGIILYILSGEDFFELSNTGYLHGSHNHYVNPIQYKYEL